MPRLLALACLLASAPLALAQAPKWTVYSAKADGFTVLMPGPVQTQSQSTMGVQTHLFLSAAAPFVGVVSKTLLTPSLKQADVAQMANGIKSGMLRSSGATETGDHPATYAGRSGREIDFKTKTGGTGALWIVRTPKAVYSLTFAKQNGAGAAEAKRFFGSFQIK